MYKFLVVFALGTVVLIQGCPRITERSSWGARSPNAVLPMTGAAPYVVIHHTKSAQCHSENACARELRNFRAEHMSRKKNFTDIGYNFLIDHNGNVYEGRGWGVSGEHAPPYNEKSVGISIIGNYQSDQITQEATQAAQDLIACGVSIGKIAANYKLVGHKQTKDNIYDTTCPGENLYQAIQSWPQWTSSP